MTITNFRLHKLSREHSDALKEKLANPGEFTPSEDNAYIAEFEVDGVPYHAGIRLGRRTDVAEDIEQYDAQLRIRDESWETDSFIPEWTVADILKLLRPMIDKELGQ